MVYCDHMGITFPLTIKITIDKDSGDAPYVAYSPEFEVASCGPTEEKARKNLLEALEITLEELQNKGKLPGFLAEMGFEKKKTEWKAPRVSFEPFFFHFAS